MNLNHIIKWIEKIGNSSVKNLGKLVAIGSFLAMPYVFGLDTMSYEDREKSLKISYKKSINRIKKNKSRFERGYLYYSFAKRLNKSYYRKSHEELIEKETISAFRLSNCISGFEKSMKISVENIKEHPDDKIKYLKEFNKDLNSILVSKYVNVRFKGRKLIYLNYKGNLLYTLGLHFQDLENFDKSSKKFKLAAKYYQLGHYDSKAKVSLLRSQELKNIDSSDLRKDEFKIFDSIDLSKQKVSDLVKLVRDLENHKQICNISFIREKDNERIKEINKFLFFKFLIWK